MNKLYQDIYDSFEGKLIGSSYMSYIICKTLAKFPKNIINYVTHTCWFFGSLKDAWAYTLTANDFENQNLILLSDELLTQKQSQISFTIAHEIGHVILGHRNSIVAMQSKQEVNTQEKAADAFAKKYLK